MLKRASNATESNETVPPPSTGAFRSAIAAHLHGPALRPGDSSAHEQQILLGEHLDNGEATLGDPAAAHPARTTDALEHTRRRGRGADRARRPDVVRAVRLRAALEVVALDRALKALALRGAGHLDLVTRGKRFDRNRVSDEQLAGLVAELAHDAMRRGVGLLQVPELGLGQRL